MPTATKFRSGLPVEPCGKMTEVRAKNGKYGRNRHYPAVNGAGVSVFVDWLGAVFALPSMFHRALLQ